MFDTMVGMKQALLDLELPPRRELSSGAWVDHVPGLFDLPLLGRLLTDVPWQADKRTMYDRVVDVPRLQCWYDRNDPLPLPELATIKARLDQRYEPELGERFATAGLCLYRDGRDSVAWHGDRIGRGNTADTMVAIVSFGDTRTLALRPVEGGRSIRIDMANGDLLVMGGSCQRTWQHCVPKTLQAAGPRVSVQFRPRGVR